MIFKLFFAHQNGYYNNQKLLLLYALVDSMVAKKCWICLCFWYNIQEDRQIVFSLYNAERINLIFIQRMSLPSHFKNLKLPPTPTSILIGMYYIEILNSKVKYLMFKPRRLQFWLYENIPPQPRHFFFQSIFIPKKLKYLISNIMLLRNGGKKMKSKIIQTYKTKKLG